MPWKEVSIMSQRFEFVTLAAAENANVRHLCRCYGISPNTAYKWLGRFQSAGKQALEDRSRQPHNSPARTSKEMEEAIREMPRDAEVIDLLKKKFSARARFPRANGKGRRFSRYLDSVPERRCVPQVIEHGCASRKEADGGWSTSCPPPAAIRRAQRKRQS